LQGWSVVPASRWAATSNVEVGQTTDPVCRDWYRGRGEKGARDKVTKRRRGKERVKRGGTQRPLAKEGGAYFDICASGLSRYATADGVGLPTARAGLNSQSALDEFINIITIYFCTKV